MPTPLHIVYDWDRARWVPEIETLRDAAYFSDDGHAPFRAIHQGIYASISELFPGEYELADPMVGLERHCFEVIDRKSSALIDAGFEYQGLVFSMSTNAQARYLTMKTDADELPHPLPINTLDDRAMLLLETPEDSRNFARAARNHVLIIVGSGTQQKQRIRDAVRDGDVDFLEQYHDPR